MQIASYRDIRGFTIFELIIAMGLATVVLGGALALTSQAVGISDMVTQRAEMQQNGRVAVNLMSRDLSLAGTGFASEGIQLPSGTPSQDVLFACDPADCYVTNNVYPQDRMFAINPGDGLGPTINGVATDVITLVYRDATSDLGELPLEDINVEGTIFEFDWDFDEDEDPVFGVKVGDVLVFTANGFSAVGQVTHVVDDDEVRVMPGSADALNFNQPTAGFGSIKSIIPSGDPDDDDPTAETYVHRIDVITYYIDASDPDSPRLMRQVGGKPPVPVAENVEDLQITYDIFDETAGAATADLVDAGGTPNLIRKTNITLTVRSPVESLLGREFQYVSLTTSVGSRNLTFRDRYE